MTALEPDLRDMTTTPQAVGQFVAPELPEVTLPQKIESNLSGQRTAPFLQQQAPVDTSAVISNLPDMRQAFVRKYTRLAPSLKALSPEVRSSLVQLDLERINKGQAPLSDKETVAALFAAVSKKPATAPPKSDGIVDLVTGIPGGLVSDVAATARAIPSMLFTWNGQNPLYKELVSIPKAPEAISEAIAAGDNPIEALAKAPGVRLIPGAYTVGNLAGGTEGIKELLRHPGFTTMDVLPYAGAAAKATTVGRIAANEGQAFTREATLNAALRRGVPMDLAVAEAEKAALKAAGAHPVLDVLTKKVDASGTALEANRLGRVVERGGATKPGQFLKTAFGNDSRQVAGLLSDGQQRVEVARLGQSANVEGALGDNARLAAGERLAAEADDLVPPARRAELTRAAQLGTPGWRDGLSAPEQAFVDRMDKVRESTVSSALDEGAAAVDPVTGEVYSPSQAKKLNAQRAKKAKREERFAGEVAPRVDKSVAEAQALVDQLQQDVERANLTRELRRIDPGDKPLPVERQLTALEKKAEKAKGKVDAFDQGEGARIADVAAAETEVDDLAARVAQAERAGALEPQRAAELRDKINQHDSWLSDRETFIEDLTTSRRARREMQVKAREVVKESLDSEYGPIYGMQENVLTLPDKGSVDDIMGLWGAADEKGLRGLMDRGVIQIDDGTGPRLLTKTEQRQVLATLTERTYKNGTKYPWPEAAKRSNWDGVAQSWAEVTGKGAADASMADVGEYLAKQVELNTLAAFVKHGYRGIDAEGLALIDDVVRRTRSLPVPPSALVEGGADEATRAATIAEGVARHFDDISTEYGVISPEEALAFRTELSKLEGPSMDAARLSVAEQNLALARGALEDPAVAQARVTLREVEQQHGTKSAEAATARAALEDVRTRLADAGGELESGVGLRPKLRRAKVDLERIAELQRLIQEAADPASATTWAEAHKALAALKRRRTSLSSPSAVGEGGAKASTQVGAIARLSETIGELKNIEAKLGKAESAAPGRWHPLLEQEISRRMVDKLVGEGADAADAARVVAARQWDAIDGFSKKAWTKLADEVGPTWKAMRDQGYDPWFVPTLAHGQEGALIGSMKPKVPGLTITKNRELGFAAPQYADMSVSFDAAATQMLRQQINRDVLGQIEGQVAHRYGDIVERYMDRARADVAANPRLSVSTGERAVRERAEQLAQKEYQYWNPNEAGVKAPTVRTDPDALYIPKHVAKVIDQATSPQAFSALQTLDPITGTFRVSVLALSPRWHLYNIIGNALMALGTEGPGVFKYWNEARKVIKATREGESVVPARLAASLESGMRDLADDSAFMKGVSERAAFEKVSKSLPARAAAGLVKKSYEVNQFFDDTTRVMAYKSGEARALKAGWTADEAAKAGLESAKRASAFWVDMTPWERQVLRRVFPFYSFTKKIMGLIVHMPLDHPVRTAIMANFAAAELEDMGQGLPMDWLNTAPLGATDSKGNQKRLSMSGLNPFADAADLFTLKGFLAGANPVVGTVLDQLGADTGGGSSSFGTRVYDPDTGKLTDAKPSLIAGLLGSVSPQLGALYRASGRDSEYNALRRNNPDAANRLLVGGLGFPTSYRTYNEPQTRMKTELARVTAQRQAWTNALATGDFSAAAKFPELRPKIQQVQALAAAGLLDPYHPAAGASSGVPGVVGAFRSQAPWPT